MKTLDLSGLIKGLAKNKYVLLVLALGVVLMLLPGGSGGGKSESGLGDDLAASGIPLDTEGGRISQLLSEMDGVGRASVLLSSEGAVVLCDGARSAQVRLDVTRVVMSYTGLGSDKIAVMKMK